MAETVKFLIVMGVAGCGKTTIATLLAQRLGWAVYDADAFHPPENIAKMTQGIPLDDHDRAPWLAALHAMIRRSVDAGRPGVLACSALKQKYRDQLIGGIRGVKVIYLKGSYELIWSRLSARSGHYMKPEMLRSQFADLEEPADALVMDITPPADAVAAATLAQLCELGELPGEAAAGNNSFS